MRPAWLAFEEEGDEDDNALTGATMDQFDVRAAAGDGVIVAEENRTGKWMVPYSVVQRMRARGVNHIVVIEAEGDSMSPTIRDGDPIWVSTHPDDLSPFNGGVFVINDGLATMVKRLDYIVRSDPPTVRIVSDNPTYESKELTADEFTIKAKVLAKLEFLGR